MNDPQLLQDVINKIQAHTDSLIARISDPERTVQIDRTYYDCMGRDWIVVEVIGNPYEECVPTYCDHDGFGSYYACQRVIGGLRVQEINRVDVFGRSKYGYAHDFIHLQDNKEDYYDEAEDEGNSEDYPD